MTNLTPHRVGCICVAPPCVVCRSVTPPEQIPTKQTCMCILADEEPEFCQMYLRVASSEVQNSCLFSFSSFTIDFKICLYAEQQIAQM